MPLIEELPVTSGSHSRTSHGWAYVPDTGFNSSRAAISANAPRNKRLARDAHRHPGFSADTTAKQQKAIAAKIADLDKENWKDAAPIPIPTSTVTKTKGKATPNVRKILTSGRNFSHFLNDYDAELASQPQQAPPPPSSSSQTAAAAAAASAMPPPPPTQTPTQSQTSIPTAVSLPSLPPNPLLTTPLPKPPSQRVMSILVSEPPLSYHAARGGRSKLGLPVRHFCSHCGYWGKVRCRKCGDRTCGRMDCWRDHEAGGCQAAW